MNDLVRHLSTRATALPAMVPFAATAAAGSLGLALAHGNAWLAVVLWLIGFGLVAQDAARSVYRDGAGFAREVPARALLFAAASAGAVIQSPRDDTAIWAIGVILMATVLVEPLLLRALPRREVVNLPGYRPTPGASAIGWLTPATTSLLLLAGLLGVADVALGVRWLLLLAGIVVSGATVAIGLLSWRDRFDRRARLYDTLTAHAPQFVIYTGREDGGWYQIEMWLPYLERLGVPYAIVVRRQNAVRALAGLTDAPIIARSSLRALDDVMVNSIRVVFYVNSIASNSDVVAYRNMRHVYLGHGDSDKSLSHHPVHAMYDQVFVAGQAAIDRYRRNGVRMRPDAFVVVGRPQLEAVHQARARLPELPTLLYAPTWIGYNSASVHSSLPVGPDFVTQLLQRNIVVVFRPHPFSRKLAGEKELAAAIDEALRQDTLRTGRAHQFGPAVDTHPFADTANLCDALIADMSSIMVDFLGSNKPMAVMVRGAHPQDFVERHPVAQGAYLVEPDRSNLTAVLDDMLGTDQMRAPDPMRSARARTREYYLGGLDGPMASAAFLTAARECLQPVRRPVATGHVFRPGPRSELRPGGTI